MSKRNDELKKPEYPSDPHTAVKHLIYARYSACWMGKILNVFPKATIVDAYAGAGRYTDGKDGSPVLFAKTLLEHSGLDGFVGKLELVTVELMPARVALLADRLRGLPTHPKLQTTAPIEGDFQDVYPDLSARLAKKGGPVLWVLDPYDWANMPFELVEQVLTGGKRDEALLTFFVDPLYRFWGSSAHANAVSRYLGGGQWRGLTLPSREGQAKRDISDHYERQLREAVPGLHTGRFGVAAKNDHPLYDMVFASHSTAGKQCWTSACWRLDRYAGRSSSAKAAIQFDLLADQQHTTGLLDTLRGYAGTSQTWDALTELTLRMGFQESHLRAALKELAASSEAIREEPVSAKSDWPAGSVVRFYPSDLDGTG